jgi:hypothetical protein
LRRRLLISDGEKAMHGEGRDKPRGNRYRSGSEIGMSARLRRLAHIRIEEWTLAIGCTSVVSIESGVEQCAALQRLSFQRADSQDELFVARVH